MKRDSFKTILRKSGFKATPARLAILEIFAKSKRPLATQDIIDALSPPGKKNRINQVTAYRTFKSLKTAGIIRPIDLRHNHAHYELADMAEHHHLICISCGKIEDVHHCGIEDTEAKILRSSKHFAEIREHALEFYGICKSCIKKSP